MSRRLVLKRTQGSKGSLALHDAITGELLVSQQELKIESHPNGYVELNVKFIVDGDRLRIVGDHETTDIKAETPNYQDA
ncbi:hypothetical protein F909_04086 [Acinetobacter sp. ANC 3929]|uniref:hypothetical protein n=1 Tax=Acinetobacter TaxID=469 RepID=UPI0002CD9CE3|nr:MULTISPECIES: hypothetical protein [Acinetobacter]ENW78396.1 hypothetical protein F909_04086 [Acinetobacter sp. ANC 3929]MPW44815.1 hypothetical protein [Acinetobacter guerrae]PZT87773.1 MAG: hypothetical protein DI627_05885 [Acinetobacter sp.]RSO82909.1 hypothetical protein EA748_08135 [Acinetobacter ursingii]